MGNCNQTQWMVRYKNHKVLRNMDKWIEWITWSKKAAKISETQLRHSWKNVEVVPYVDPARKRLRQIEEAEKREREEQE